MAKASSRKLGDFTIVEELAGKGGQGRLFSARCDRDGAFPGLAAGQVVVLKVMPVRGDDPDKAYRRLKRRTDALVASAHPGIVRYWGCFAGEGGLGDDVHVVVMELLHGETLEERLKREPLGLDAAETLRIVRTCLEALVCASGHGIVHRDLKPSNVFLCDDGGVKLIDFEIAQTAASAQTTTESGAMQGTYDYMAPDFHPDFRPDEKFRGDACSDVFSLSVVFHEALTGRRPYPSGDGMLGDQSMMAFFRRWSRTDGTDVARMVRVDALRVHALRHVQKVLKRGLSPERSGRFATYGAMLEALSSVSVRELKGGKDVYRLSSCVGKGGFGAVYKAWRASDGTAVAVKFLTRADSDGRFWREARTLERFSDDRIVSFVESFEVGRETRMPVLVMEFLPHMPGSSLKDRLAAEAGRGGLPAAEVVPAFVRFAEGLSVLHRGGVVHRDIKPANLYLPAGEPGKARLMDLGIVRTDETQTNGGLPGTPDYMAPEFARSATRGNARSDLYALGLCFFEALTGRTAFPRLPRGHEAYAAWFDRVRSGEKPDLSPLDWYPEARNLFSRLSAADPVDRFYSAAKAADAFRSLPIRELAPPEPEPDSGTLLPGETTGFFDEASFDAEPVADPGREPGDPDAGAGAEPLEPVPDAPTEALAKEGNPEGEPEGGRTSFLPAGGETVATTAASTSFRAPGPAPTGAPPDEAPTASTAVAASTALAEAAGQAGNASSGEPDEQTRATASRSTGSAATAGVSAGSESQMAVSTAHSTGSAATAGVSAGSESRMAVSTVHSTGSAATAAPPAPATPPSSVKPAPSVPKPAKPAPSVKPAPSAPKPLKPPKPASVPPKPPQPIRTAPAVREVRTRIPWGRLVFVALLCAVSVGVALWHDELVDWYQRLRPVEPPPPVLSGGTNEWVEPPPPTIPPTTVKRPEPKPTPPTEAKENIAAAEKALTNAVAGFVSAKEALSGQISDASSNALDRVETDIKDLASLWQSALAKASAVEGVSTGTVFAARSAEFHSATNQLLADVAKRRKDLAEEAKLKAQEEEEKRLAEEAKRKLDEALAAAKKAVSDFKPGTYGSSNALEKAESAAQESINGFKTAALSHAKAAGLGEAEIQKEFEKMVAEMANAAAGGREELAKAAKERAVEEAEKALEKAVADTGTEVESKLLGISKAGNTNEVKSLRVEAEGLIDSRKQAALEAAEKADVAQEKRTGDGFEKIKKSVADTTKNRLSELAKEAERIAEAKRKAEEAARLAKEKKCEEDFNRISGKFNQISDKVAHDTVLKDIDIKINDGSLPERWKEEYRNLKKQLRQKFTVTIRNDSGIPLDISEDGARAERLASGGKKMVEFDAWSGTKKWTATPAEHLEDYQTSTAIRSVRIGKAGESEGAVFRKGDFTLKEAPAVSIENKSDVVIVVQGFPKNDYRLEPNQTTSFPVEPRTKYAVVAKADGNGLLSGCYGSQKRDIYFRSLGGKTNVVFDLEFDANQFDDSDVKKVLLPEAFTSSLLFVQNLPEEKKKKIANKIVDWAKESSGVMDVEHMGRVHALYRCIEGLKFAMEVDPGNAKAKEASEWLYGRIDKNENKSFKRELNSMTNNLEAMIRNLSRP